VRLLKLVKRDVDCLIVLRGWTEITRETLEQALRQLRSFEFGEYYLEVETGKGSLVIAANIDGTLLLPVKYITHRRIEKLLSLKNCSKN